MRNQAVGPTARDFVLLDLEFQKLKNPINAYTVCLKLVQSEYSCGVKGCWFLKLNENLEKLLIDSVPVFKVPDCHSDKIILVYYIYDCITV